MVETEDELEILGSVHVCSGDKQCSVCLCDHLFVINNICSHALCFECFVKVYQYSGSGDSISRACPTCKQDTLCSLDFAVARWDEYVATLPLDAPERAISTSVATVVPVACQSDEDADLFPCFLCMHMVLRRQPCCNTPICLTCWADHCTSVGAVDALGVPCMACTERLNRAGSDVFVPHACTRCCRLRATRWAGCCDRRFCLACWTDAGCAHGCSDGAEESKEELGVEDSKEDEQWRDEKRRRVE